MERNSGYGNEEGLSLENASISRTNGVGDAELEYTKANMRDYFWRKYDGLTSKNSNLIKKTVDTAFRELQNEILERVGNGATELNDVLIKNEDIAKYQAAVQESCERVKRELAKELGVEPNEVPPAVNNYIATVTQESASKISESIGAIKSEVEVELAKLAGEDSTVIRKALTAKFDTLLPARAKTIANTTAANATSAVQYTMYRENGFKSVWLTQRDGAVRPAHLAVDGQYPNESGYFLVGGEQTTRPLGGGLSARNAVNCRCQLFPER
jgi:hypothetical protein